MNRRLLLLVDNIDVVLSRLAERQEWEFRRIISEDHRLLIIGSAARSPGAVTNMAALSTISSRPRVGSAHRSGGVPGASHLAERTGQTEVQRLLQQERGRTGALCHLAGGNPERSCSCSTCCCATPEPASNAMSSNCSTCTHRSTNPALKNSRRKH